MRLPLRAIDPAGAVDGDVPTFDGATGRLVYAAPGASGGGGSSTVRDRRWVAPGGSTTLDAFNDEALATSWVRVDGSGAAAGNVNWVEGGDALSVENNGGDSSGAIHGLVRPLSTPPAVGDAFVTCFRIFGKEATQHTMAGLVLADGATHGSGGQIVGLSFVTTNSGQQNECRSITGWTTAASGVGQIFTPFGIPTFQRLVYVAADTWRVDVSPDGVGWLKGTGTLTKALSPTHVGVLSSSWGTATKHVASYEFLRRTAGVS